VSLTWKPAEIVVQKFDLIGEFRQCVVIQKHCESGQFFESSLRNAIDIESSVESQ
jgi:hypothetical protein